MNLSYQDIADLKRAVQLLEHPGFAVKLTNMVGSPVEKLMGNLPKDWAVRVNDITRKALEKALQVAVKSLELKEEKSAANFRHTLMAGLSGAVGGAFGIAALAVELPVSTGIIMRSIADVARSEGEDLSQLETQLACLEVFALGGRTEADDAAESGYYLVRTAIANAIPGATYRLANEFTKSGSSILGRTIGSIASRFGVTVSQKAAAQLVPVVGAVSGAAINVLFTNHFQEMALGHFTIRRLERKYNKALVQETYNSIMKGQL
jgi:hypothetical protein